jgi:hypothetical protein
MISFRCIVEVCDLLLYPFLGVYFSWLSTIELSGFSVPGLGMRQVFLQYSSPKRVGTVGNQRPLSTRLSTRLREIAIWTLLGTDLLVGLAVLQFTTFVMPRFFHI